MGGDGKLEIYWKKFAEWNDQRKIETKTLWIYENNLLKHESESGSGDGVDHPIGRIGDGVAGFGPGAGSAVRFFPGFAGNREPGQGWNERFFHTDLRDQFRAHLQFECG